MASCSNTFPAGLDPQDIKDYAVDFNPILSDGITISSQSITLPAEAIAAGLEVSNITEGNGWITATYQINVANQTDPSWVTGVKYDITYQVIRSDGKRYTKYVTLLVQIQAARP